jgi:hypothetical protein
MINFPDITLNLSMRIFYLCVKIFFLKNVDVLLILNWLLFFLIECLEFLEKKKKKLIKKISKIFFLKREKKNKINLFLSIKN